MVVVGDLYHSHIQGGKVRLSKNLWHLAIDETWHDLSIRKTEKENMQVANDMYGPLLADLRPSAFSSSSPMSISLSHYQQGKPHRL